jgi:hypothetical protein
MAINKQPNVTNKPKAPVKNTKVTLEIDSRKLETILDDKIRDVGQIVLGPIYNHEQALGRNELVGRLLAYQEIKQLLTELVDDTNSNILDDEDM